MKKLSDLTINLSEMLKTTADNLVGHVGESSKKRIAATGEDYVEVVFPFKDENDLMRSWGDYIKSYITVARNVFRGDMDTIHRNPTIYWSQEPDILLSDTTDCFILYAVFLISNRGRIVDDT